MTVSMTGYASATGQAAGWRWVWDVKGVNGRGLDLRIRVPDWIDGLDVALRGAAQKALGRGNVTLSLRLTRDGDAAGQGVDDDTIARALDQVAAVEAAAMARGVDLAPSRATDILGLRVLGETAPETDDLAALKTTLVAEFKADVLPAFVQMRRDEGAALDAVLRTQLDTLAELTGRAAELAEARRGRAGDTLKTALARVLDTTDAVDPDRIAQELAMLAVKSDVSEELDRLKAHIVAARALLDETGPVGRKLDFLMQEFNREANTLCAKSQDSDLTQTGLDLKTTIDQMREQVQNVE